MRFFQPAPLSLSQLTEQKQLFFRIYRREFLQRKTFRKEDGKSEKIRRMSQLTEQKQMLFRIYRREFLQSKNSRKEDGKKMLRIFLPPSACSPTAETSATTVERKSARTTTKRTIEHRSGNTCYARTTSKTCF